MLTKISFPSRASTSKNERSHSLSSSPDVSLEDHADSIPEGQWADEETFIPAHEELGMSLTSSEYFEFLERLTMEMNPQLDVQPVRIVLGCWLSSP